jgi:tetratricopeptide (TPR) repeat protein
MNVIVKYLAVVMLACLALQAWADDYEQRRKYDVYFLEAMLERQKGHHDAAFSLLGRCLEIRPDASESYFFLGQYYSEMKQADAALRYFRKASELEPANMTYMEILAQALVSKEEYAEATTVVEKIYEADKSRQELLETLYKLYMREGSYDKAIRVLERMESIDGKSERLSLAKSGIYLQMEKREEAQREIKALSEQYPNDLNYRTLYANTLLMDDRQEEARRVLAEVLAEEPGNYKAQVAMRTYYLNAQDTLRADSLTRSILLNPVTSTENRVQLLRQEIGYSEQNGGDSTRVLSLFREMLAQPKPSADMAELCAAYMQLKNMPRDSIADMLRLVLRLAPDNAGARLQLVQYAWEEEQKDSVIKLCQEARQYNPDEMAFYYYQGIAYYQQDNHDKALEAFQNGISVISDTSSPAIVSDFYAVMGDLLHQKGREREAFAAYDSCLQWKPDNIGCLNNYAYYLSTLGQQLDRAEEMSSKTIKAEPRNGTYLDTYAWILFMQKRYDEARIYIEQAVACDSAQSSVILEHAGDIFAMAGNLEKALDYWNQALAKDSGNKTLIRKIKRKKYIK